MNSQRFFKTTVFVLAKLLVFAWIGLFNVNCELSKLGGFLEEQSDDSGGDDSGGGGGGGGGPTPPSTKVIYRSVGPSNTSPLDDGNSSSLTISSGVATFSLGVPDRVGIGDALQYDCDGDNDGISALDSDDCIVFISERNSSTSFDVVNAAGDAPADLAVPDTDWSLYRAYSSLFGAEEGTENTGIDSDLRNFDTWTDGRDLATNDEQWNIVLYADAIDVTGGGIDFDNWTTAASNYLKVFTPTATNQVGVSQRHKGYWNSGGYTISSTTASIVIDINSNHVRIEGLKIYARGNSVGDGVVVYGRDTPVLAGEQEFSYNLIRASTNTYRRLFRLFMAGSGTDFKIWNNVMSHDSTVGANAHSCVHIDNLTAIEFFFYNNTINNCGDRGISFDNFGTDDTLKNNIVQNTTGDAYRRADGTDNDYNIGDDANLTGGTNDVNTTSVVFVDEANHDFRLAYIDAAALGAGDDLSSDPDIPITDSVDGQPRTGSNDIGAGIASIASGTNARFRSVGTTGTAIHNGIGKAMTLSNGVATFATAISNSAGVGDVIQYDCDEDDDGVAGIDANDCVIFIHERYSSTQYLVRDKNGNVPADMATGDSDWSMYRAYTSLFDAEAGTANTNIDADVISEVTGGDRDIASNEEQWYLALYNDGTDTTSVVFDGWTTSEQYSIKVFTPYLPKHVGTTQRHDGTSGSGYTLNPAVDGHAIRVNPGMDYMHFEGLEVTGVTGNSNEGFRVQANYTTISHSIIYDITGTFDQDAIHIGADDLTVYVYNVMAYNLGRSVLMIQSRDNINAYVYNVTGYDTCNNAGSSVDRGGLGFDSGLAATNSNITAKNTFIQSTPCDDFEVLSASFWTNSTNNASSDTTAQGASASTSVTPTFVNAGANDYRPTTGDTDLYQQGVDLSLDPFLPFEDDMAGNVRSTTWSIGPSVGI